MADGVISEFVGIINLGRYRDVDAASFTERRRVLLTGSIVCLRAPIDFKIVVDYRIVELSFGGDSLNDNLFSSRDIRASWLGDMLMAVLLKILLLKDRFILFLVVCDIFTGDFFS